MATALEILKRYWGYDAFRSPQGEIIDAVMNRRDTVAILPTGGGKSICFQVPSLAQPGLCLVISPLIALMKDQVDNLKKREIPALLIHSGMKRADVIRVLENATSDYFKFLYVSPERLETSLFKEYLPAMNVNLIAIDEAHCISQWGYDFRPAYLRIASLREDLPDTPVLALTASATAEVQQDIADKLQLKTPALFRPSFERKNLTYCAYTSDAKPAKLVEVIQKVEGTAIVYCKSRKRTVETARLLNMHGISASFYHAGLGGEERAQRQKDWIENRIRVICCTNAFGMGIDKPDVRLVVHTDLPDCLENYYQEAGRAGRDGKKSYAVLLYHAHDCAALEELHLLRYPSLERIRFVYNALVNFLQIPAYTGEYKSYDFRFEEFVRNFKLDGAEALYALKALESDGWIDFNEQAFTPSTLVFQTSKNALYEFYKVHPQHEELLTVLLRSYGGVFDFPSFISERNLAKLTRRKAAAIVQELQQVARYGIISYTPQNDSPQIIFRKHRVPAADLRFDLSAYEKRKAVFQQRAKVMVGYTTTDGCRSRYINHYFGDAEAKDCGHCDNCLKKKKGLLTPKEFDTIAANLTAALQEQPLLLEELLQPYTGLKREKLWQVIELMQSEQKIVLDKNGKVILK